jgi:hypothetical protein
MPPPPIIVDGSGEADPWVPTTPAQSKPITPIAIYRYDPLGEPPLTLLYDNLQVEAITFTTGPSPPTCTLSYRFVPNDPDRPGNSWEAISTAYSKLYTVQPDERIAIYAQRPDEEWKCIFDGYARTFNQALTETSDEVTIHCIGHPVIASQQPLDKSMYREAQEYDNKDANFYVPAEPPYFDPQNRPNMLPQAYQPVYVPQMDEDQGYDDWYQPFLSPGTNLKNLVTDPGTEPLEPEHWPLSYLVMALIHQNNRGEFYVTRSDELRDMLVTKIPIDEADFDPNDAETFEEQPIYIGDFPCRGRDWPTLAHMVIADKGFSTRWRLETDEANLPKWHHDVYPVHQQTVKTVWLQTGGYADYTQSNIASVHLTRDINSVVNVWDVEGAPRRYEASFVLHQGFPATEADTSRLLAFDKSNTPETETDNYLYRLFILDESGEGHYVGGGGFIAGEDTLSTTAADLSGIFGEDEEGIRQYARRRRIPLGQLITKDSESQPLRPQLSISNDYEGPKGVWDGTGTWQPIANGGWQILEDRVGIYITAKDANAWSIGESDIDTKFSSGMVKIVECLANPSESNPLFHLRLTCVIEGDDLCIGQAPMPTNTVLDQFTMRTMDARERYIYEEVCPASEFNPGLATVTDDTHLAEAEARAIQDTTKTGLLTGDIVIPWFTAHYRPGDRLASINGRNLSLRTDPDPNASQAIYPIIEQVTWNLKESHQTTLSLSDQSKIRTRHKPMPRIRQ